MNLAGILEALKPAVPSILAIAQKLLPIAAGSTPLIGEIATVVTAVAPIVVQEYQDLKPIVVRIIAALKADPAATQETLDALIAAEELLDADFEDAVRRAELDDAEADKAG